MGVISKKASQNGPQPDDETAAELKGAVERLLGDVSKASATQQLVIGTASGWCTGMLATKVGKAAALVFGASVIALQVMHRQGCVTVNWDQLFKKAADVADKLDDRTPGVLEKMERYVDRKLDTAERVVQDHKRKAKTLYYRAVGDAPAVELTTTHFFLAGFVVGLTIPRLLR